MPVPIGERGWDVLDRSLIFSVGGKEFVKVPLKLNVAGMSYATGMEPVEEITEPAVNPGDGTDGFFITSYALLRPLPTFKMLKDTILYTQRHYNRYSVDLNGTFEEYTRKFKARTRQRIRNRINKFRKHCNGEMHFKCCQTVEEFEAFYPLALSISKKTYQHRLHESGLTEDEQDIEEYRRLAVNGNVRGFLLFDNDKPVAYKFLTIRNHVALSEILGYDPEYAKLAVGTILEWLSLEHLFADENLTLLDFGFGEDEYKQFFGTESQLAADIFIFNKTFRNLCLVTTHLSLSRIVYLSGQLLDKIGLKRRIKRMIRETA